MAAPNEKTDKASSSTADGGAAEVQAAFDEANAKGYFGEKADPTPNEHYTLQGVADGKPTPETDPKAAAAVEERAAEITETPA